MLFIFMLNACNYSSEKKEKSEKPETEKQLYATVMAWPESGSVLIKSLGKQEGYYTKKIKKVKLVSTGQKLKFKQDGQGLEVHFPIQKPEASYANALEIV